jgi:L-amino acid N-acyltransferase YncA
MANTTPDQVAQLQSLVDIFKAAVSNDTAAQVTVANDAANVAEEQATLAADTAIQVATTGPAVSNAGSALLAYVTTLVNGTDV